MRNTIFFILFFLLVTNYSMAQFEWISTAGHGGAKNEHGHSLAVDNMGNLYVAGTYFDTCIFNTDTLISLGDKDCFVSKYNSIGNLQWVKNAGSIGWNDGAINLRTDKNGFLYVLYYLHLDGYIDNQYVSAGSYLVKFSSSGLILWKKKINALGINFFIDSNDNIYISGQVSGALIIGSNNFPNSGIKSFFICKTDTGLNFRWAKFGSSISSSEFIGATSMVTDSIGSIYVCGYFAGSWNFGIMSISAPNPKTYSYLLKYDSLGNFKWVRQTSASSLYDLDVDDQGNSFITGGFSVSAVFDTIVLSNSNNIFTCYVAKYDSTGNILWAKSLRVHEMFMGIVLS